MTACATQAPPTPTVTTKGKTQLAVEALQDELLQECEGMPPLPENSVGSLLEDATQAMSLLAQCMVRQSKLIRYIRPIVEDERKQR